MESRGGLRRRKALAGLVAAIALASPGCVSKWSVRSSRPEVALQWPYPPGPAKVTFVESLTGFSQDKNSGTAFKTFVYGGEPAEKNAFVLPVAVAEGGDGRIAVADLGRRCVHLYVPATKTYLRISGPKAAALVSPVAVAFDETARLFVSDSSGKLFAFGPDGAFLFAVSKAGAEPFRRPTGLAYNPRKKLLYVVDTLGNRVVALHADGSAAFSFGERGEDRGFNYPTHIFCAQDGTLYVTNALAFRIEIFDEDGRPQGSFGRHGDGSGDLAMPKGIAVDRDGIVYVVDSLFDNVQLFNRKGEFLLTVGRRGVDFGEFWLPSGAFISSSNRLFICDTYNRRIQVFRIAEHYAENAS